MTASRDTWNYRASKFIQRNRLTAAAAGLILLALLSGLGATFYQANIAWCERARSERRFADVRQIANSFLFEFHDAIENLPGATPARELVVKRAVEYLDKLSDETGDALPDAGLQRELATAYERIGKIQGNSYHSNLGDTPGAMASYQKSLEIRRRLNLSDPANREIRHELASAYEGVGDIFYTDNDLPNGLQNYEEALAIRLPLVEAEPQNRKYLYALAELRARRGDIKGMEGYANLGDTLGAIDEYARAVAIAERLVAVEPDDRAQTLLANNLRNLAVLQNTVGKSAEALANGRRVMVINDALVVQNPNNEELKIQLMASFNALRYPLVEENLLAEAEKNARYVISEMEKTAAADPENANARRSLSVSYNDLGRVLKENGQAREAITHHERSLQIIEKLSVNSPSGAFKSDAILTRSYLAQAQLDAGNYAAALANFERCAEEYEKELAGSDNKNARTKDDLAAVYTGIGRALGQMKQFAHANEFFARAVPLAEETAVKSPYNVRVQGRLSKTYFESGKNLKQAARAAGDEKIICKSCELLQKSFDIWDRMRQNQILSRLNRNRPDEVLRELSVCQ